MITRVSKLYKTGFQKNRRKILKKNFSKIKSLTPQDPKGKGRRYTSKRRPLLLSSSFGQMDRQITGQLFRGNKF